MIRIDRNKLLNTDLGLGSKPINDDGRPCIKCAIIGSCDIELPKYGYLPYSERSKTEKQKQIIMAYHTLVGYDGIGDRKWEYEYPALAIIMDRYEKELMKLDFDREVARFNDEPDTFNSKAFIERFIAEAEMLPYVEFYDSNETIPVDLETRSEVLV